MWGGPLTEHQYLFINSTVLYVFNFKCLVFQIEHRQGVKRVFAFNNLVIDLENLNPLHLNESRM